MSDITEATKEKILQSAKAEFMNKGFTNASLRTIAASAGLTTGAMYRHFKDKNALFCALVDEAVEKTLQAVNAGGLEIHTKLENPADEEHNKREKDIMVDYLNYMLKHRDTFILLISKSAGSTHENFLSDTGDLYTKNVLDTVHWMQKKFKVSKPIDDMSIHVLASATVNAYAEVVLHNMKKKEAMVFISNIQEFFHFGFMHLLGLPCGHED